MNKDRWEKKHKMIQTILVSKEVKEKRAMYLSMDKKKSTAPSCQNNRNDKTPVRL